MAEAALTQAEADRLVALEKHAADQQERLFPGPGERLSAPLVSADGRESFLLDINRASAVLSKVSFQNRTRQVIILVRLDLGSSHRNPDDAVVGSPHLHVYREGFADKWALSAPLERFRNPADLWQTLEDFQVYCNVVKRPIIRKGIFS